jgi:spore germination protein GerM
MAVGLVVAAGYYLWSHRGLERIPGPKPRPTPAPRIVEITLYFADDQADFLVPERRRMRLPSRLEERAKAVLNALISGPKGQLQPTIPEGTRLLGVSLDPEGVCTVDFNKEFVSAHPGGTTGELMTVYSVVQSLVSNVPSIRAVRFLVEGKAIETLTGHLSLKDPIRPDPQYTRP